MDTLVLRTSVFSIYEFFPIRQMCLLKPKLVGVRLHSAGNCHVVIVMFSLSSNGQVAQKIIKLFLRYHSLVLLYVMAEKFVNFVCKGKIFA